VLLLIALCVIVPIVEIAVFVQVASWIGAGEAVLLLLAISLLGAWLVKAQGVAVLRTGRTDLAAGRVPGRPIVDGLLIATAGLLLLVPGFVTAVVGLALLVPLTRVPLREHLIRRWTRRARTLVGASRAFGRPAFGARSVVVAQRSDPEELGGNRAIEPGDEALR